MSSQTRDVTGPWQENVLAANAHVQNGYKLMPSGSVRGWTSLPLPRCTTWRVPKTKTERRRKGPTSWMRYLVAECRTDWLSGGFVSADYIDVSKTKGEASNDAQAKIIDIGIGRRIKHRQRSIRQEVCDEAGNEPFEMDSMLNIRFLTHLTE